VRVCDSCLEELEREDEAAAAAHEPGLDPFEDDSDSEVCLITEGSLSLPSEDQTQPLLPQVFSSR
jgi:hypothetical protein